MEEFKTDTMVAAPATVKERIDSALEILSNFSSRNDKSMSRADVLRRLSTDLSEYYGYIEELTDFLLDLFAPSECVEYMDSQDRPRPLVIRANTIKTTRKDLMELLVKRGVACETIEWSKVAIKVTDSQVPIGATPEYLGGYYMLQSAASLNPVMALAPLPGERVLDMSAAPGGKTSYIAQLMKNSGTLIANDLKPQRQKATIANLHRLGVKNAIVCCYDGRKIAQVFKGFDRVMLDAPCSGLGVISRDPSVKIQRTVKDVQRISHLQKELLRAAVDAVDPKSATGGIVVYSTCSISVEEDEQVIDYILRKRFVKLVNTGLEVGKPGFTRHMDRRFHPSLNLTRRFYPHVHNMDGFFVAKLKKYANGEREDEDEEDEEKKGKRSKALKTAIDDYDEDDDDEEEEEKEIPEFNVDDNVATSKQTKAQKKSKREREEEKKVEEEVLNTMGNEGKKKKKVGEEVLNTKGNEGKKKKKDKGKDERKTVEKDVEMESDMGDEIVKKVEEVGEKKKSTTKENKAASKESPVVEGPKTKKAKKSTEKTEKIEKIEKNEKSKEVQQEKTTDVNAEGTATTKKTVGKKSSRKSISSEKQQEEVDVSEDHDDPVAMYNEIMDNIEEVKPPSPRRTRSQQKRRSSGSKRLSIGELRKQAMENKSK